MTSPDAGRDLDRLAQYPASAWHPPATALAREPALPLCPRSGTCTRCAKLQGNVAKLADHGWCFELQVFTGQMPGACELVDACPDVTFVLQHAGMLEDLSDDGRRRLAGRR